MSRRGRRAERPIITQLTKAEIDALRAGDLEDVRSEILRDILASGGIPGFDIDLSEVEDVLDAGEGAEDTAEDVGGGTSLQDLTTDADVGEFDRTFRVTSSDVPFAPDETPAIPRPWQGLPRVAVTYNLNFVYDDDEEEWIRDTGNGLEALDSGSVTVPG